MTPDITLKTVGWKAIQRFTDFVKIQNLDLEILSIESEKEKALSQHMIYKYNMLQKMKVELVSKLLLEIKEFEDLYSETSSLDLIKNRINRNTDLSEHEIDWIL